MCFLDDRQITHLICARLKYDLYDFFIVREGGLVAMKVCIEGVQVQMRHGQGQGVSF